MDPITQQAVLATAGAAAAGPGLYVDEVFSTDLWPGTASAKTITTGIDLATEGGMVWMKNRTGQNPPTLRDTERGSNKGLDTNSNNPEYTSSYAITAFTSSGFTLGADATVNGSSFDFVGWSFRKAPGFFDICEWTGNSVSGRQIAHNLGSAPGFIMVKSYVAGTGGTGWMCYHRSVGNTKAIRMDNGTAATDASSAYWNNTDPTSTHFTVGNHEDINTTANSRSYVAYVFAHDSQTFGTDSDEAIIKCGSYTGSSSTVNVNLGFEPQWVMVKASNFARGWIISDTMRGAFATSNGRFLSAENTDTEATADIAMRPTSTGFSLPSSDERANYSGVNYVYIAIRRPHKPPTAATEVFSPNTQTSGSQVTTGFVTDTAIFAQRATLSQFQWFDRLRAREGLETDGNAAGFTRSGTAGVHWDYQNGYNEDAALSSKMGSNAASIYYGLKRAPGFFDVVAYSGNNVATNQNHNLGVPPELIITKVRTGPYSRDWNVGPFVTGYSDGYLNLNNNNAGAGSVSTYFPGTPTSAIYGLPGGGNSGTNGTGYTYISYLFATLSGISKVGTYTGTGNAINVDCGFSSGARFVLIKRTDSTGDWYVYDSARGIVSGNDPYKLLNTNAAAVTNTDYIDPLNSGFTVTSSAPAGLNASSGTYLFLAIA